MQPNMQQQQRALQVDVQQVLTAESGEYGRMIAQLVRNNAVLATALEDREAYIRELETKVRALTGSPVSSAPGRPMSGSADFAERPDPSLSGQ